MKVVSLILAAGEAKRFGFPKQILPWNNSTILGTVINESLESGFSDIFVVLGAHFDKITEKLRKELSRVHVVKNDNWQNGMFSSVKKGLTVVKNLSADYILIQLGDMPFITSSILEKFIKVTVENPNVVIASENNKPAHPYMFHKKFINEIISANYPMGMKNFINREFPDSLKIETDKQAARQDIDTWDIYKKFFTR